MTMMTVIPMNPAEQKKSSYSHQSNGHYSGHYGQGFFSWQSSKKNPDNIETLLDKGMRLVYLKHPQHLEQFIEEKASKWTHKSIGDKPVGRIAAPTLRVFWQFLARRCVSVTPGINGFWMTIESMQGTRKEIIAHFNDMCHLLGVKPTNKLWEVFLSPTPHNGMGITCPDRVWATKRESV